jgi:AraC-like DNA-binding protein
MKMAAFHENLIFDDKLPVKVILHSNPGWRKKVALSHWHNSIEICYVIDGHPGTGRINGESFELEADNAYVIGPNVIHSFDSIITRKDEVLTLLIPLEWLTDQINDFNEIQFDIGPIDVKAEKNRIFYEALNNVLEYKRSTKIGLEQQVTAVAALHYIAAFVLTQNSSVRLSPANALELGSPLMIQQMMSKMQNNYQDNLTISELSAENHISEAHLIRVFKKYVGVSPKSYLIQIRLAEAARMLRQTESSIEEISSDTGFGSPKNFFVLFRKKYQMTPKEYRQKNTV